MILEKGLPCNIDAEKFLLGSIQLEGNERFVACAAVLAERDFALEKHRLIWTAMQTLDAAGRVIGRVEVANELTRLNQLESVDGLSYLISLDDGMPHIANLDSYVQIICDKSVLRQIAIAAQSLMNRALLAGDEPGNLLADAERTLALLSQRDDSRAVFMNPGGIMDGFAGGFDAFITPSRGGNGIHLPWPDVDSLVCSLQPADFMVLAARPSHGKTSAALQIALATAKAGKGVAYFSLEMSRDALIRRLISAVALVDSQKMRNGHLSADERERIRSARQEIESLPIWTPDYRGYTTPAIRRALKMLMATHEIGAVIVDHFHLLQSIGHEEDRQRYGRAADDLQRYAKEFSLPFVVLAQLNRKCEDENRAPGLSDLAETGKLEQNADIVMFAHRPELYAKNRARPELHGVAEFIVAKQRNGPVGKIDMVFLKHIQKFE
jgi:replicative DNA helicase